MGRGGEGKHAVCGVSCLCLHEWVVVCALGGGIWSWFFTATRQAHQRLFLHVLCPRIPCMCAHCRFLFSSFYVVHRVLFGGGG